MPFVGSRERAKPLPDHFEAHYLFRTEKGIITSGQMQEALKKLASHLIHEEHPYLMTAHQFRHSLATDMIEQGGRHFHGERVSRPQNACHDGTLCEGLPYQPQGQIRCLSRQEATDVCL